MREALEEDKSSDVAVAAAAAWLVYAAPTVYGFCQQSKSFDGKVAKPGSAVSDQNWTGYSQDRWQLWTKKISGVQVTESTASQLVHEAQAAIGEIEQ